MPAYPLPKLFTDRFIEDVESKCRSPQDLSHVFNLIITPTTDEFQKQFKQLFPKQVDKLDLYLEFSLNKIEDHHGQRPDSIFWQKLELALEPLNRILKDDLKSTLYHFNNEAKLSIIQTIKKFIFNILLELAEKKKIHINDEKAEQALGTLKITDKQILELDRLEQKSIVQCYNFWFASAALIQADQFGNINLRVNYYNIHPTAINFIVFATLISFLYEISFKSSRQQYELINMYYLFEPMIHFLPVIICAVLINFMFRPQADGEILLQLPQANINKFYELFPTLRSEHLIDEAFKKAMTNDFPAIQRFAPKPSNSGPNPAF